MSVAELSKFSCVGASGAITAVLILFAINYPRAMVFLLFIPMPAWVLGIVLVGIDLAGTQMETGIAHGAHLGGAAFAILYWFFRKPVSRIFGGTFFQDEYVQQGKNLRVYSEDPKFERNPNRIHHPDAAAHPPQARTQQEIQDEQNFLRMKGEVERILQKIAATGQDSLTPDEKRTLMEASEIYKRHLRR